MNTVIIEDDPFYANMLSDFCPKAGLNLMASFEQPLKALSFIDDHSVELVFLDMNLPDLHGFEVMEHLKDIPTIIITQDETQAVTAFEYSAVDFLVKPIEFGRFLKAVRKVEDKKPSARPQDNTIYVNINKRLIRLECDQIQYISAKGNYIDIILEKGDPLTVHTTLKNIETLLPQKDFKKVHRSHLVNLSKIVDIEDSTIVIGRKVIPLGNTYRESLLGNLNLLQ
jgi:DNA-binding LytR/AlgR family response regulator